MRMMSRVVLAALVLALGATSALAAWPERPIKVLIGYDYEAIARMKAAGVY